MRFFFVTLCLGFLFSSQFLCAQAPVIEWQRVVGGIHGENGHAVEATSDGGYIVSGVTEGPDNNDITGYHGNFDIDDYLVVKLDATGAVQWQKCLGGISMETNSFIHQTADGGYIVAGSSASMDCNIKSHNFSLDYWVVKLNSKGDIEWQKSYGGSKNEYAWGISITKDGGYIIAGHSESNDGDVTGNHGDRDYWVIKIDAIGALQWQKSLGGSGDDEALGVDATADGGCIVAGYTASADGDVTGNHGKRDYWVVKLDNTGGMQWQKSLGGTAYDGAWSVKATAGGGYIVAGFSASNDGNVAGNHVSLSPGFSDYWVVKLDASGNLQWQRCYGGKYNEIAYAVSVTPDGGYVIAGTAESADGDANCNSGSTDIWVIKVSSNGNLEWQKSIGGNYYDEAFSIEALADGTYIVAGNTCSPEVAGYHQTGPGNGTCGDIWVLKLAKTQPVKPLPVVTINPAAGKVCAGAAATFTASVLYGGSNPIYQWQVNGIVTGTNSSVLTATGLVTNDKIVCTVAAGGGCETSGTGVSNTVVIQTENNIIQPAISIAAGNGIICDCTPVDCQASVLNAGASPHYEWLVNGSKTGDNRNVFTSNMLKDGDQISCVYTDNATCVANGFVVSNIIKVQRAANQLPVISITATDSNTCSGTPVTFTAVAQNAGLNPSYQWTVNGVNMGTGNNVFISSLLANHDKVSCTLKTDPLFVCTQAVSASSNVIEIRVNEKLAPTVHIITSAAEICTGVSVQFTAAAQNAGTNPFYQWKINGGDTGPPSNNTIFTSSAIQNGDVISCIVTADPLYNCALPHDGLSNDILMKVTPAIIPAVSITASAYEVCAGEPVRFDAVALNAGLSPLYTWKLNNITVGTNSPVYSTTTLKNGDEINCAINPGAGGCSSIPVSSNQVTIGVNSLPLITLVPADTSIFAGNQIQLKAFITGAVASYEWSPSNMLENAQSLAPFTLRLTNSTSYALKAVSDKGCRAAAVAAVKVYKMLYMPNAFTPNGDQRNDVFRIPPDVALSLKEFSVFNRWGKKIFATKDINTGWDGTVNGIQAVAGAYMYVVSGRDNNNSIVLLKGSVVLIR